MPEFALADVAFGPIFFVILGGSLAPFLVALVLETVVLWALRWAPPGAAFADVAVANLVSAVAGFVFFRQEGLLENGWFWVGAWLLSALIEGWVLRVRRETTITRAGIASLLMNTASYIFLVWVMKPAIRHW